MTDFIRHSSAINFHLSANEGRGNIVRLRQPKKPESRIFSCIWVMRARMTREIKSGKVAR